MRIPLLNANTALSYLRARGLLNDGGEVRVCDLSRRNHNLSIEIDGKPAWLIKQMQYDTPEVVESLAREAHCYRTAQEEASFAPLRGLMPRCAQFDSGNSILVLGLLDGANAAEAHSRVGSFDVRIAEELGRVIGTLHRAASQALLTKLNGALRRELPWVLRPLAVDWQMSGRSRFLAIFEADPAIAQARADLRASWRMDTLIHGDARPENFVLCRPQNDNALFDTKLVDWELADWGDAAWDCANVMQFYWNQWALTGKPKPQSWKALEVAVKGFWTTYQVHANGSTFRRVVPFTGARLIQTAYEQFASAGTWTPAVQTSARLARLLLTETEQALRGFEFSQHAD